MDQLLASTDTGRSHRPFTVARPHDWDGIGQALRAAYRDHQAPSGELAAILRRLDTVD